MMRALIITNDKRLKQINLEKLSTYFDTKYRVMNNLKEKDLHTSKDKVNKDLFSDTISPKKSIFDFTGRTLHPDILPAKDRITLYKRKLLEKSSSALTLSNHNLMSRPDT
jgi:hypothetical protein